MSALYLGVVVLPLLVLVWNLGIGSSDRRSARRERMSTPSTHSPSRFPRLGRLRAMPAAFAAGFRSALSRSGTPPAHPAAPSTASAPAPRPARATFELAPDVPRSPSSPGWVPASGYAARPRA